MTIEQFERADVSNRAKWIARRVANQMRWAGFTDGEVEEWRKQAFENDYRTFLILAGDMVSRCRQRTAERREQTA